MPAAGIPMDMKRLTPLITYNLKSAEEKMATASAPPAGPKANMTVAGRQMPTVIAGACRRAALAGTLASPSSGKATPGGWVECLYGPVTKPAAGASRTGAPA